MNHYFALHSYIRVLDAPILSAVPQRIAAKTNFSVAFPARTSRSPELASQTGTGQFGTPLGEPPAETIADCPSTMERLAWPRIARRLRIPLPILNRILRAAEERYGTTRSRAPKGAPPR